jgi:hypothetical protein
MNQVLNDGEEVIMNVGNMSSVSVLYRYDLENLQEKNVIIIPKINQAPENSTLSYNIEYGRKSWMNLTGITVIKPNEYEYNPRLRFRLTFRGFIRP